MNELTPFIPKLDKYPQLLLNLESLHIKMEAIPSYIHKEILFEIKEQIKLVNNYYSNQIESEGTHPYDIESAMQQKGNSYSDKQRLALAYQKAQDGIFSSNNIDYSETDQIMNLHKVFYSSCYLKNEQVMIKDSNGMSYKIVPGATRSLDVEVGLHLAPKTESIKRLLKEFHHHYSFNEFDLGITKLIKTFAAHHRFMFIHPFLDGNGRVGRLITDGMLKEISPRSFGLWSISRGLSRHNKTYKLYLSRADQIRQGSTDGRGQRTEKGLVEFISIMTDIALDQVNYMGSKLQLDRFEERLSKYINQSELKHKEKMLQIIPLLLIHGSLPKKNLHKIFGCSERTARNILNSFKNVGLIKDLSNSSNSTDIKLNIDQNMMRYLFPDLVPEPISEVDLILDEDFENEALPSL